MGKHLKRSMHVGLLPRKVSLKVAILARGGPGGGGGGAAMAALNYQSYNIIHYTVFSAAHVPSIHNGYSWFYVVQSL